MSLVNVINKVLNSDKNYSLSQLGDNGVEFSAPGLYMGNFVLYDCEKNFIFLQGSRIEFKEDVTGLGWEEIAEKIIFKLDWRKRLGAIIYQPDDEKKEVQDGLGNYFHKSDIDNSKVEMYDAEPFRKYFCETDPVGKNQKVWIGEMTNGNICYHSDCNYSNTTIKQITPDIQHIITPSKNYFLFKLSK